MTVETALEGLYLAVQISIESAERRGYDNGVHLRSAWSEVRTCLAELSVKGAAEGAAEAVQMLTDFGQHLDRVDDSEVYAEATRISAGLHTLLR